MGFFSTFGDLQSLSMVRSWTDQAGIPSDVAPYASDVRKAMPGSLDPRRVSPRCYSHLIVVCGPCWPELFPSLKIDLAAFSHCTRIGVNLTMLAPLALWNPFHVLLERDSDREAHPDLAFLTSAPIGPVVGLCMVDSQHEYGTRQRHAAAGRLADSLFARRAMRPVPIDTRWPPTRNRAGQSDLVQLLNIVSRMDAVVTSRLHGMVFSLLCGVPPLVIDPIAGGAKVSAQARAVGWPLVLEADRATDGEMDRALEWCLTAEAREAAAGSRARAMDALADARVKFLQALGHAAGPPVD